MTQTHTRAPWFRDIGKIEKRLAGKLFEGVFNENGDCVAICFENVSDINLIAAAPELLEALEAYIFHGDENYVKEKAGKAIAKAKGEIEA